jgi:DNA-binding NtrC family response regulator
VNSEHPGLTAAERLRRVEHILLGHSELIRELRQHIVDVGPLNIPALLEGPTGSGKGLVARSLHEASARRGAFVKLNVGAVAESLFEPTLFGHVKGAFTGAVGPVRGYFTQAEHGTLLLDDLNGLPVALQVKLLQALDDQTFRPVGAEVDRRADFRVVAATNEGANALVAAGRLRPDLLHRLSGDIVRVPAVAERVEDVPILASHFAREAANEWGRPVELTRCALDALQSYSWPGNVRELRNTVRRAIARTQGGAIQREDIERALSAARVPPPGGTSSDVGCSRLIEVLHSVGWDITAAARACGCHRRTIHRRIRRYGIVAPRGIERVLARTAVTEWDTAGLSHSVPSGPSSGDPIT